MSVFKIVALLIAAAVVGIAVTNAVYFNRLYKAVKSARPATRNSLYGANAQTNALAMLWINIILAVIAGLFLVFALFKIAGVGGKPAMTTTAPANMSDAISLNFS